jgi:hypothetical protein
VSAQQLVGVIIDGVQTVHAPACGSGTYDTLCGIDADDPKIGHGGKFEPHHTKFIDCAACYAIWKGVTEMRLRRSDFSPRIR